jgi:DNA mismatch endonuclease (patch repair protein)
MPKTNRDYWEKKIRRNQERDQEVNKELTEQGWQVIRVWEYDIKHGLDKCIQHVVDALGK